MLMMMTSIQDSAHTHLPGAVPRQMVVVMVTTVTNLHTESIAVPF